jgi:phage shock protein C
MLFGVCGGLGEYLNVDPTVIRLIFVLAFLPGGPGLIAYLALALLVPEEPLEESKLPRTMWRALEPNGSFPKAVEVWGSSECKVLARTPRCFSHFIHPQRGLPCGVEAGNRVPPARA